MSEPTKVKERTTQYYACEHGIPGGCQFCNATKSSNIELLDKLIVERDRLRERVAELESALRNLLEMTDHFPECNEFRGGYMPFSKQTARELLAKERP